MPQLSVIIPFHNRSGSVKSAVESLMAQSISGFEAILVNDGSSAEYDNICRPYQPIVKLLNLPRNAGVSAARNAGAAIAKGEFIAFLDSDDLWLPNKAVKQLDFMKENNALISHTDEFWYKKDTFVNSSTTKHAKYEGNSFAGLLDKCRVSPSSLMISRELFVKYGGFDESLRVCEDYEFFIRIGAENYFHYLPEKLIIKRDIEENSLSRSIPYIESIRLEILMKLRQGGLYSDQQQQLIDAEIEHKRQIVKIKSNLSEMGD